MLNLLMAEGHGDVSLGAAVAGLGAESGNTRPLSMSERGSFCV
jgi:hypothetical protein